MAVTKKVENLPTRLDLTTYSGDDFSVELTFTDSSGSAYDVDIADVEATITRTGGDVTLSKAQTDTNVVTLSATESALGTQEGGDGDLWEFRNTTSDRTWIAGRFRINTETPVSTSSTESLTFTVDGSVVSVAVSI